MLQCKFNFDFIRKGNAFYDNTWSVRCINQNQIAVVFVLEVLSIIQPSKNYWKLGAKSKENGA